MGTGMDMNMGMGIGVRRKSIGLVEASSASDKGRNGRTRAFRTHEFSLPCDISSEQILPHLAGQGARFMDNILAQLNSTGID